MSDVVVSIFKKIIILIIVATFFLDIFASGFNLISTVISYLPSFCQKYMRVALVAVIFTSLKRMLAED